MEKKRGFKRHWQALTLFLGQWQEAYSTERHADTQVKSTQILAVYHSRMSNSNICIHARTSCAYTQIYLAAFTVNPGSTRKARQTLLCLSSAGIFSSLSSPSCLPPSVHLFYATRKQEFVDAVFYMDRLHFLSSLEAVCSWPTMLARVQRDSVFVCVQVCACVWAGIQIKGGWKQSVIPLGSIKSHAYSPEDVLVCVHVHVCVWQHGCFNEAQSFATSLITYL